MNTTIVCNHVYVETGEKELCKTCVGKVMQKVRVCTFCNDRIVGASEAEKAEIERRRKEKKLKEALSKNQKPVKAENTPRYIWEGVLDPIQDPNEVLPKDEHWTSSSHWSWNRRHHVKHVYLEALKKMAVTEFKKPEFTEDFGVVVLGGDSAHGQYGLQAAVSLRMLYEVCGYKGYAEWQYRGSRESIDLELIRGIGDGKIIITNLDEVEYNVRVPSGWLDKSLGLARPNKQLPFRYALRLDADAYCTIDPTPILKELKNCPLMFWTEGSHVDWARTWPEGDYGVPGIQGGQIFVDRKVAFDWLVVSSYIDSHKEFYYPPKDESDLIETWHYGDQGSARLALIAKTKFNNAPPYKVLGLPRFANSVHEYTFNGKVAVVHRVCDKMHDSGFRPNLKIHMEKEAHACLERCMYLKRNSTAVFTDIYKNGRWVRGAGGSASGPGSEVTNARPWIAAVNNLVNSHETTDPFVLDLGCGEGTLVTRYNIKKYLGVDVYLTKRWPAMEIMRSKFDFWKNRESMIWKADIWLLKDVLQHWPDLMISDWLKWAWDKGHFKKLLVCNDFSDREESDILLGGFRGLHWDLGPMKGYPWKVLEVYQPEDRALPKKAILMLEKSV